MLLALLAAAALVASPAASPVLVAYDFDGDEVETGPYTLIAYEHARGSVALSTRFKLSGSRSVEIRDVAGDGEFAELQGFFRELPAGRVHVHFALMFAETGEAMNVALAGAGHFAMRQDGFGFWLKLQAGRLFHVSAGQDLPLFSPQPFVWYVSDVAYDVGRGTYDLTVRAEGQSQPLVSLRDVPNPVGRPGHIHKFSFIGDPPGLDRSNARFYVDDIVVRADRPVDPDGPFVAPGRRMSFVDMHRYYQARLTERPGCLPALGPEDFGLAPGDLEALATAGPAHLFDQLAERSSASLPKELPEGLRQPLEAMLSWGRGCAQGCTPACALRDFERAQALVPEGKLYAMSRVLALAGQKRWTEADALLMAVYPDWRADPRYPAAAAVLGLARGDLDQAEREIGRAADRDPGEDALLRRLWSGDLSQALLRELQAAFPGDWPEHVETALAAEQRYYVLLWQERYDEARVYAERMAERMARLGAPHGPWLERQGDAFFWIGDLQGARASYDQALASLPESSRGTVYTKLSDVYYRLGDLERERQYREKVYGSLRH
jgi:hypothetical protein